MDGRRSHLYTKSSGELIMQDYTSFCFKALSHYNVLANVCPRMKNLSSRWHTLVYAEMELKNQRKPLYERI